MVKVKYIGAVITMLNGFRVLPDETCSVSEKQANSLISEHPDDWVLVGGSAQPNERPAPELPPVPELLIVEPVEKQSRRKKGSGKPAAPPKPTAKPKKPRKKAA
jgi:hypothetical protein